MSTSTSGATVLAMKPRAPAARACTRTPASLRPDIRICGSAGAKPAIALSRVNPSSPGSPTSMTTTSAVSSASHSSACPAVPANDTTQFGRRTCAMRAKPSRNKG